MGQNTLSEREMQAQRLKIKQIGQQMQNLAAEGAGLSPWGARELVQIIEEVYFKVYSVCSIRHDFYGGCRDSAEGGCFCHA